MYLRVGGCIVGLAYVLGLVFVAPIGIAYTVRPDSRPLFLVRGFARNSKRGRRLPATVTDEVWLPLYMNGIVI